MKIIFICTGNTCRSPTAKDLFCGPLAECGITDITCDSAGLFANPGEPTADNAVTAYHGLGVGLSTHRAEPLSQETLQSVDLFIVMMQNHAGVLRLSGIPQEKTKVPGGGVGDPFGDSMAIYRADCDQI